MTPMQRFFKLLELDKKDISYIYLYAIFAGIITLSLPLGIQAIINLIIGGELSSSLYLLIGIITLGIALTGFLTIMQLTVTETLRRRIFTRSAFEFAMRIPRLKLENISVSYPPELVNRFFDTVTLQKGVPKILIDFSTAILQIFFGLILLSLYHPFFVFFGFMLILILLGIFRLTGKKGMFTSLEESTYKYKVAQWLQDMGLAMKIFKLSDVQRLPLSRTDVLVESYLQSRKKHFSILLLQFSSVVIFKTVVTMALLALGSILVINNQISIGQFVAAEIIVILILNSVEKLIIGMDNIYDVLTALEKIVSVSNLPLEREDGIEIEANYFENGVDIHMDRVSFRYPHSENYSITDIDLKIEAGQSVCISGTNGSGKSTLLKLIGTLYEDYKGMITFNGIPLKNLKLNEFRKHIGYLSTQDDIFNGSILENIRLGNLNIKMQDIVAACKNVGLHSFINALPDGYKTELINNGQNLPSSIIAKIVIVRALVLKPKILLLDHFLTRIENRNRMNIIKYLLDKSHAWTIIMITNNPKIAEMCDKVIMIKDGRIVGEGSFNAIVESEVENKKQQNLAEIFETH